MSALFFFFLFHFPSDNIQVLYYACSAQISIIIIYVGAPRREAGDVLSPFPVWNLRAVIWFPFPISPPLSEIPGLLFDSPLLSPPMRLSSYKLFILNTVFVICFHFCLPRLQQGKFFFFSLTRIRHSNNEFNCLPINPFTAQPVKFPGLIMHRRAFNGIFSGLLSMLYVLMKTLLRASAKKKTKRLKGFALLLVVFKWHHVSEGVNLSAALSSIDTE